MPLPPKAELERWHQQYFVTERGRATRNTRTLSPSPCGACVGEVGRR